MKAATVHRRQADRLAVRLKHMMPEAYPNIDFIFYTRMLQNKKTYYTDTILI